MVPLDGSEGMKCTWPSFFLFSNFPITSCFFFTSDCPIVSTFSYS